jgi:spore coat polysaccharide biosynthesis predicted glycosyltransferase SpsG
MLPKRVIFAANAMNTTGAGHVMRLIEISSQLPLSIEKHFFGFVDLAWVNELLGQHFHTQYSESEQTFGRHDVVVVDSYDRIFCENVMNCSQDATVVQVADRYTPLLANSHVILMDLPFDIESQNLNPRIIAHGIQFIPARKFNFLNKNIEPRAKSVLVTTGGSVDSRIFSQLISEFTQDIYQGINFHLVGIPDNLIQTSDNLTFHNFSIGVDLIAQECDTAISTAGTSMWSLLANNLIIGVAAIVENQRANYGYVVNSKHALPLFDLDNMKLDIGVLRELLFDDSLRQNLFRAISGKYDTLGASRVCDLLLKVHRERFL